jgi:hypothetical protein
LAESEKGRGDRPKMSTLCGCSVRHGTEYKEATELKEVNCKRCKKGQRIFDLGNHGERSWHDSVGSEF